MSIEYSDQNGLEKCLEHFANGIKRKVTNHEKIRLDEADLEWINVKSEIPYYRIEDINGNKCMIIPSKMNDDE